MVLIYFNSFSFHCMYWSWTIKFTSLSNCETEWMKCFYIGMYERRYKEYFFLYTSWCLYELKKYAKKCHVIIFFFQIQFETLWFSSVELSSTSDTKSEIFLFASPWRTKNGSCRSCGYAARSLTSFFNLKIVRYLQSKLISVY